MLAKGKYSESGFTGNYPWAHKRYPVAVPGSAGGDLIPIYQVSNISNDEARKITSQLLGTYSTRKGGGKDTVVLLCCRSRCGSGYGSGGGCRSLLSVVQPGKCRQARKSRQKHFAFFMLWLYTSASLMVTKSS